MSKCVGNANFTITLSIVIPIGELLPSLIISFFFWKDHYCYISPHKQAHNRFIRRKEAILSHFSYVCSLCFASQSLK